MELRPPTKDDAPAIVAVARPFGLSDESVADVEAWFDLPSNDLENDARVAIVEGQVVGYGDVGDASSGGKMLWLDVRTGRDAAPLVLDWVERRAREKAVEGAKLKAWSPEENAEWRALLESKGFELHGYSFRMWIDLGQDLVAPAWPDGISVRTYRRDEDEQAVYEAHQEAFSEEPDFSADPFEDWKQWSYREPFDPGLWFVAREGDEVAGILLGRPRVLSQTERAGDATVGWINILGVRKPWRGRGLALALLQHAFRAFEERGKPRVGLGVDGRNPTAIRLYERAGMKPQGTLVWYQKEV